MFHCVFEPRVRVSSSVGLQPALVGVNDAVLNLSVHLSLHDHLEFFGMHTYKWVAESEGAASGWEEPP